MTTSTANKPVFSTRHGQIDVAAWKNQSDRRTFYSVSLKRSFKQDDGWKSTQASVGQHEALGAAKLLDWADTAIEEAIAGNVKADGEATAIASKKRGNIEVAVFQKTTESGTEYRVSLTRYYKDGEESKQVRVWLQGNDCLAAGRLFTRAFDALDELPNDSNSSFVQTAKSEFQASGVDDDIPF